MLRSSKRHSQSATLLSGDDCRVFVAPRGVETFPVPSGRTMDDLELWMLAAAALVLLAIIASKLSARSGVPVVVLFLAVGMLAGSDGPGNIAFEDYDVTRNVGVVALAYILFAGGFATRWSDVRSVVRPAVSLATIGVVVTAVVTGTATMWVFNVSWREGLLLGAIVSSTDAAAVFAVLRSADAPVPSRARGLLEMESGFNDPMAVFLTITLIDVVTEHNTSSLPELLVQFVGEMALGVLVGLGAGWVASRPLNRLQLEFEGLYPVLTVSVVALVYAATARIGGSGFLAVYLAGLVIGNSQIVHRRSLMRFLDAVAWLMQIGMFLVLGLLVFPSDLPSIALRALAITAVLVLVARPLATFVSLALSGFGVRERLLVSWLGLRGAVPIVLATFPVAENVRGAHTLFDVVFFVVLVSVLVQGTTLAPVARALGVGGPAAEGATDPAALERVGDALHEVRVSPASEAAGRPIVDLQLPAGVLVVLVSRDGERFIPQGSTVVRSGDRLLLLADDEALAQVRRLFSDD